MPNYLGVPSFKFQVSGLAIRRRTGAGSLFVFAPCQRRPPKIRHQPCEHSADFIGGLGQTPVIGLRYIPLIECDVQERPQLAAGSLGNGKKLKEFPVSVPLEALGDISHYGRCCAAHLIAKSEIARESLGGGHVINGARQLARLLPCLYVFKAPNRAHALPLP